MQFHQLLNLLDASVQWQWKQSNAANNNSYRHDGWCLYLLTTFFGVLFYDYMYLKVYMQTVP